MNITHRIIENGVVVIDIEDDRFEYPKTQVLKNHVVHLLKEGHKHLVLNLSNVEMLDSFGIAVFISTLKMARSEHGNLTLFGLNEKVNKLIELTRMDRVLDIWETEGQAVAHVTG
ncbi:MAG: STAS domain-containing protein [Cyanobacteria bacterium]|nr:STAS domain-containing protein [Cyanobacteriota bacterium]